MRILKYLFSSQSVRSNAVIYLDSDRTLLMPAASWKDVLEKTYGKQMVDVFEGTQFASYGAEHGFGLYVFRNAYEDVKSQAAHVNLETMFRGLATTEERQQRSVTVGSKATGFYKSVQAVSNDKCKCLWKYAGAEKHRLYNVAQFKGLHDPLQWVQALGEGSGVVPFNQILSNLYEVASDDKIPAHTDSNPLLNESTEILSLSLGAPGVFCFEPDISQHDKSICFGNNGFWGRKRGRQDEKRQGV